jgi:hypothetical protein
MIIPSIIWNFEEFAAMASDITVSGHQGFLSFPEMVCACLYAFPLVHHYRAVLAWGP